MNFLLIILIILALIGIATFIVLWRVRQPIPYPTPESLIIPTHTTFIPVDGVINLRDIGGFITYDDKRVKSGIIYRSANLSYITPTGKTQLMALKPCLICDLRSDEEVANDPHPELGDVNYINFGIATEGDKARRLWLLIFRPRKLNTLLPRLYQEVILEENASALSGALRAVLDEKNLPMLIHCTAGKDRTGVVVALILALLGVPEDKIIADYTQSNHFYTHYEQVAHLLLRRLGFLRLNSANLFPILVADPNTMRAVFDYLRDKYGGVAEYTEKRLGFGAGNIAQLKRLLLE